MIYSGDFASQQSPTGLSHVSFSFANVTGQIVDPRYEIFASKLNLIFKHLQPEHVSLFSSWITLPKTYTAPEN